MDSSDDDPFHPSPLSSTKGSVQDLLEDAWFFGKVLSTKPAGMSRCYSDPSPNIDQRLLTDNPTTITTTSSSNNLAAAKIRIIGRREEVVEDRETSRSSSKMSKLNRQLSDLSLVQKSSKEQGFIPNVSCKDCSFPRQKVMRGQPSKHKLLRTPSLPSPCIGMGEEEVAEEDESDITMSRLIREATVLSSEVLPPRSHSSKGMSMQKNRSARNLKELGYPKQRKLKKNLSFVEPKEEQGFKELGLTFKQRENEEKVKRAYLLEAWYAKTCAPPPIPIWGNKSSAEDMKLQIKYWARAVASKAR
ncbi:uncharacterized protein [Euphorbia lathyris]|uniref:uncharacterized protein isoform X2 n=1 Tax=Euphorbia lathyris TaxID=212925 RepID=UPI0033135ADD